MINLKLKFTTTSQFNGFADATNIIMIENKKLLQANDYFHYFNFRNLQKKILDIKFKNTYTNIKPSISININEFESFKYVYFLNPNLFNKENYTYYEVVLLEVLQILDKQIKNLSY